MLAFIEATKPLAHLSRNDLFRYQHQFCSFTALKEFAAQVSNAIIYYNFYMYLDWIGWSVVHYNMLMG